MFKTFSVAATRLASISVIGSVTMLSLGSCAPTVAASMPVTAPKPALARVFPDGYDPRQECATFSIKTIKSPANEYHNFTSSIGASFVTGGTFPKPTTTKYIDGPSFDFNCPDYEVIYQSGYRRTDSLVVLAKAGQNVLDLLGTIYPDFFKLRSGLILDFSQSGRVGTRGPGQVSNQLLVGIQQGSQPLLPVIFNGATQLQSYDPAMPFEVVLKDGDSRSGQSFWLFWQRLTVNLEAGEAMFSLTSPLSSPQ